MGRKQTPLVMFLEARIAVTPGPTRTAHTFLLCSVPSVREFEQLNLFVLLTPSVFELRSSIAPTAAHPTALP